MHEYISLEPELRFALLTGAAKPPPNHTAPMQTNCGTNQPCSSDCICPAATHQCDGGICIPICGEACDPNCICPSSKPTCDSDSKCKVCGRAAAPLEACRNGRQEEVVLLVFSDCHIGPRWLLVLCHLYTTSDTEQLLSATVLQAICQPNASCNPNCVCPSATHLCTGAGTQVCKVRLLQK